SVRTPQTCGTAIARGWSGCPFAGKRFGALSASKRADHAEPPRSVVVCCCVASALPALTRSRPPVDPTRLHEVPPPEVHRKPQCQRTERHGRNLSRHILNDQISPRDRLSGVIERREKLKPDTRSRHTQ